MALFPISGDAIQLDSGSPSAGDPFRNGIRIATDNSAAYGAYTGGEQTQNGFLLTDDGAVVCVDASGGLPSDVIWRNGLPFNPGGALCVSSNTAVRYSNGIPFDSNGAVVTNGLVSGSPIVIDGFPILVDSQQIVFS